MKVIWAKPKCDNCGHDGFPCIEFDDIEGNHVIICFVCIEKAVSMIIKCGETNEII